MYSLSYLKIPSSVLTLALLIWSILNRDRQFSKHICHEREVIELPSIQIIRSQLDTVLGNLLQVTLLEQGGWTGWSRWILSNLDHYVILWKFPCNRTAVPVLDCVYTVNNPVLNDLNIFSLYTSSLRHLITAYYPAIDFHSKFLLIPRGIMAEYDSGEINQYRT